MKSFIVLFSGWKNGWVGPSSTWTLTVKADTQDGILPSLLANYKIEKIKRVRELKNAK